MTHRQRIKELIGKKENQIEDIKKDIRQLKIELLLICDDEQYYIEKEEEHIISNRPKKTEKIMVGRIHYKQTFYDEGTGEPLVIDRSEVVKVDGIWKI